MAIKILDEAVAPQQESFPEAALRNVARTGARGIESLLGLPGDIAQGLLGLTNIGLEKFTRQPSPLPRTTPIPTSETIREELTKPIGEAIAPGYLEPKGTAEEVADAFVSDLIPLLLPVKGKLPLGRALATAGIGSAVGLGTKQLGLSPQTQEKAKVGAMVATSLFGVPNVRKYMEKLYDIAEESIPANARVSTKNLVPNLDKISKSIGKGIPTPSKDAVRRIVDDIKMKTAGGSIPVSDAWQIKKDLNELAFAKTSPKGLEKMLPTLVNDFNGLLEQAGKSNPNFISALREADNIYQGINKASAFKKWVNNNINLDKLVHPTTALVLGEHPQGFIKGALGAFGAKGLYNRIESSFRSGSVAKYYAQAAKAAASQNIPAATRAIKRLDNALVKEFPEMNQQGPSGRFHILED